MQRTRSIALGLALAALALAAGSCLGPQSSPCSTGGTCPAGYKCTLSGDSCVPNDNNCGNGRIDRGEVCDDGNVRSGDGCRADCASDETCGNGELDPAKEEVCDDGNRTSGDGCSADCKSREGCGNNITDPGEQCDDGDGGLNGNCPGCKTAFCGDQYVNDAGGREQCDDGPSGSAGCNNDCTTSRCGDFKVNALAAEECDRGGVDTNTCNFNCKIPLCGDLYVNRDAGERCDDGTSSMASCAYGTRTCIACNAACTGQVTLIGPYCGDGDGGFNHGVDTDAGELCDDGNSIDETSCPYGNPTCDTCNSTCSGGLSLTGPYCGDGNKDDAGAEVCDDGNAVNETGCSYGTRTCTGCRADCRAVLNLVGPYCGDGDGGFNHGVDTDAGELCDDGNTVDETACPYGVPACDTCNSTCSGGLSRTGPYCGD
ncbi:MAG TPA: DUF4215 domain-containing protein, partial [Myxococcales bacterium]|nr:DUF4215 domain-containing protein [Myxococcales bacterium]